MERGRPKSRIGVVRSNKMQKSVVVEVQRRVRDGRYGKFVTHRERYLAHDETNACQPGDKVRIVETRPMSARKRWRVAESIAKAEQLPELADAVGSPS